MSGVLEQAGLVTTEKDRAGADLQAQACADWRKRRSGSREYRQLWAARFDELDNIVEELTTGEKSMDAKKRR